MKAGRFPLRGCWRAGWRMARWLCEWCVFSSIFADGDWSCRQNCDPDRRVRLRTGQRWRCRSSEIAVSSYPYDIYGVFFWSLVGCSALWPDSDRVRRSERGNLRGGTVCFVCASVLRRHPSAVASKNLRPSLRNPISRLFRVGNAPILFFETTHFIQLHAAFRSERTAR